MNFFSRAAARTLFLCLALSGFAFAQQPSAPQPGTDQTSAAPAQAAPANGANAQHSQSEAATGGEVSRKAEDTSKAAPENKGEKQEEADSDTEAQFKYSASVLWLARKMGMSKESAYWFSVLLNFAIIAGFTIMLLKRSLPVMFKNRTGDIQKGISEAQKASAEAQARLAQIESRLSRLDSDIESMRAQAEQEGRAEQLRLQAATEEEKRKILQSAEQEIASASTAARRELRQYAAELAVNLAQKKISVDANTDRALVSDFVRHLGESGVSADTAKDSARGGH